MTAKRISALFFILFFATALSNCGRTGKLYLPEDASSQNSVKTSVKSENKINQ